MSTLYRLEKQWGELKAKRTHQLELFHATSRRGNARKAAEYGYRMGRVRKQIREAETQSKQGWKLSWAARFIAPFEGLRTVAYQDSGGILTIGYGHTGPDVHPGLVITKAKALALLVSDLRAAAQAVKRNVHVPLTARQRIAAISFTFNIGEGGLQASTFLRKLNEGKQQAAADALMLWVKDAAGNTLAGLQRRRRLERWLFLHPHKTD